MNGRKLNIYDDREHSIISFIGRRIHFVFIFFFISEKIISIFCIVMNSYSRIVRLPYELIPRAAYNKLRFKVI